MSEMQAMDLAVFGTESQNNSRNPKIAAVNEVPSVKGECGRINTSKLCQWATIGSGGTSYIAVSETKKILAPGAYVVATQTDSGQPVFEWQELNVDDIITFENGVDASIFAEIKKFWNREKDFKHWGFLHRRGMLLWGPPGGGKTCIVQQVIKNLIADEGIILIIKNTRLVGKALSVFRDVERHRPLVCIFEDIDALCNEYGEESLLAALDGESTIDHVLNIATTNFPEKISRRIIARPRRFDRILFVGCPSAEVRKTYLEQRLKITNGDLNKWVEQTEGLSFAALAELVISVKCLDNSFEETLQRLREQNKAAADSAKYLKSSDVGFGK